MKIESRVAKRKIRNAHIELMRMLMKSPVTNVKFSDGKITFNFFDHKISNRIQIKKQPHVGEWSRRTNKIVIDKNFHTKERMKEFKSLCVHEAVERFLVEKFGFNTDNEAHIVAKKKEKEYLESIGGNWRSHQLKVFWDWHKLGEK